MPDLKQEVKEIVEIVALVPEEFKAKCFEMLLENALEKLKPLAEPVEPPAPPAKKPKVEPIGDPPEAESANVTGAQPKVTEGQNIVPADLHMKTKKFLEKNDLSLIDVNELFYKEKGNFESLVTDLGVTTMSEAQIRIALLQAFHNALPTGDFMTTMDKLREECKMRKTYDVANFTSILKKYSDLFDFGTLVKETTDLRLSEQGKTQLAAVVKELS